jgi:hypothetical protein
MLNWHVSTFVCRLLQWLLLSVAVTAGVLVSYSCIAADDVLALAVVLVSLDVLVVVVALFVVLVAVGAALPLLKDVLLLHVLAAAATAGVLVFQTNLVNWCAANYQQQTIADVMAKYLLEVSAGLTSALPIMILCLPNQTLKDGSQTYGREKMMPEYVKKMITDGDNLCIRLLQRQNPGENASPKELQVSF